MKRTLVVCMLLLMSLMVAVQAKDKNTNSGIEQSVAGLEQQWVDAGKASNPDALSPLLADNFANTDSDGKMIGKSETLAHTKSAKWETSQISDVKVTVFGNTAIATGDWTGKGTDGTGKAIDTRERWTDTWMKMSNGKWQCIASHSSALKT